MHNITDMMTQQICNRTEPRLASYKLIQDTAELDRSSDLVIWWQVIRLIFAIDRFDKSASNMNSETIEITVYACYLSSAWLSTERSYPTAIIGIQCNLNLNLLISISSCAL